MTNYAPINELYDLAREVFDVADQFSTVTAEHLRQLSSAEDVGANDDSDGQRQLQDQAATAVIAALKELSDNMTAFFEKGTVLDTALRDPPELFTEVARKLLAARSHVVEIGNLLPDVNSTVETQRMRAQYFAQTHVGRLNVAVLWGKSVVDKYKKESGGARSTPVAAYTCPAQYPNKPEGHIGFLQFVCDEIEGAAIAKRLRISKNYSHETLASMVAGVKWSEARRRIAAMPEQFLVAELKRVKKILEYELTVRTIYSIEKKLVPAVDKLSLAWEKSGRQVVDSFEDKPEDCARLRAPTNVQLACYKMYCHEGMSQRQIALCIKKRFRRNFSQGQVSRAVSAVKQYLTAQSCTAQGHAQPRSAGAMDPSTLEAGRRRDGRTVRQRPRPNTKRSAS